jgi:hypothetical protein
MGPGVKATLRGLVLCALVPAAVAAVISPVLGVSVFLGAFVLATFVGFPILVLLERHLVTKAWMACLAGSLVGVAMATLMFLPQTDLPTQSEWNGFYIIFAVFGITGVPAGWVLWHHVSKYSNPTPKRPDDDATVA